MTSEGARVVVGVDGSEGSLAALRLAAREAGLHRARLEVVWAWDHHDAPSPSWEVRLDPDATQGRAQARVEELVAAQGSLGEGDVAVRAVCDDPTHALVTAGEGATLLVVGTRGDGGFLGLRLGSVAHKVLGHAPCPVLVVRDDPEVAGTHDDWPVVVGVDGSAASRDALDWARREAALRGVGLRVVHGWGRRVLSSGDVPTAYPPVPPVDIMEAEARTLVDEEVRRVRADAPDLPVEGRIAETGGATAVVEASTDAGLAVVGSRGRGGFAGLVLGSVSQQVAHHADCPVVVVPGAS